MPSHSLKEAGISKQVGEAVNDIVFKGYRYKELNETLLLNRYIVNNY
jgi:hypothetical protein